MHLLYSAYNLIRETHPAEQSSHWWVTSVSITWVRSLGAASRPADYHRLLNDLRAQKLHQVQLSWSSSFIGEFKINIHLSDHLSWVTPLYMSHIFFIRDLGVGNCVRWEYSSSIIVNPRARESTSYFPCLIKKCSPTRPFCHPCLSLPVTGIFVSVFRKTLGKIFFFLLKTSL